MKDYWGMLQESEASSVLLPASLPCEDAQSQRRRVTSFAVSVRMARAHLAGQGGDGAGPFPTVFAGVFRGFVALIESVSALADSVRMTGACGAGQ